jgi:hypothetical protein
MPITGKLHSEHLGYFVVREEEGSAEIEVQDAPPLETSEDAERWIDEHGLPGVDYWVCAPVARMSQRRAAADEQQEA